MKHPLYTKTKNRTVRLSQAAALIAITSLAAVLVACQEDMDISQLHQAPKLVVYCMPSPVETTWIDISLSEPLYPDGSHPDKFKPVIIYTVNGQQQPVRSTEAGRYYADCRHQAGDHVRLEVRADGVATAIGETTIPDTVSITPIGQREIVRSTDTTNEEYFIQLMASFTDNPLTTDYYAIDAHRLDVLQRWYDDKWQTPDGDWETRRVMLPTDSIIVRGEISRLDEPLLQPRTDADAEFLYEEKLLDNFHLFNDKRITTDGQPYTLHLNCYKYRSWGKDYYDSSSQKHLFRGYRLTLYHLSPEFYQFVKSMNDAENNGLADYGLSQVSPTVSNVRGGLGFVGGYNRTVTAWFE